MKRVLLFLAAMVAWSSVEVSAFYNPITGRWLSRDPVNEPGFVSLHGKLSGQSDGPNLYLFVGNHPTDRYDYNGLLPVDLLLIPFTKSCGRVVKRAALPDAFHPAIDLISGIFMPHYYVVLDDGVVMDHGGNGVEDNHWTSRSMPLLIPKCSSCEKFTQCMKDKWPNPDSYSALFSNCKQATVFTTARCGGIIPPSFLLDFTPILPILP